MQIDGLPERIIARIKGPSINVEFITEHQLVLHPIKSCHAHHIGRRILVDQRSEIRHLGNLTRGVDSTEIEPCRIPSAARRVPIVPDDDRPSGEQDDQSGQEDENGQCVDPSSKRERIPVMRIRFTLGVGGMKGVVEIILAVVPEEKRGCRAILLRGGRGALFVRQVVSTCYGSSSGGSTGFTHAHAVKG